MTTGQRIAQKRKELGLSQEGLGEQLGVSRQAIYKWESDASLPEIEKLISLSRLFSVSVGWLLGEEEGDPSGELDDAQLKMVEEIVDRYLAARPAEPEERPRRRWPWIVLVACAAMVCLVFINLFNRLDQMTNNYNNLQNSINSVQNHVGLQIGSIANRVEEILNSQNELTAEWTAEISAMDIPANTVTFRVRVVPKTYREGMSALLVARSEGAVSELPVEVGADGAFEGEITCPLTDDIDLSVVFLWDDQRQTQVLERRRNLYSGTFPGLILTHSLWLEVREDVLPADGEDKGWFFHHTEGSGNQAEIADVKVGLFRDQKLIQWYREEMHEAVYNGVREARPWYFWDEVALDRDSVYCEAAVVTDEYGRVRVLVGAPIRWTGESWNTPAVYDLSTDPADWEF